MSATDSLLRMLDMRHPILQAPMVGVSTPALAAAVSNAGGLGSIGVGACDPAQADAMIAATQALTDRAFNVNLFCHRPARRDAAREQAWLARLKPWFDELGAAPPTALREPYRSFVGDEAMLAVLLHRRPAVVSFHFGLPERATIGALRAAGAVTLATATTAAEAIEIEAAGVDAIVAQGVEAGGHRGVFDPAAGDAELGLCALLALVQQATALPVIAAGGVMSGRAIGAMRALGAAAVQMGTAFVPCPESAASDAWRAALCGPRGVDTRLTSAISGRPARGLPNRLYQAADAALAAAMPDYPVAYDAVKALVAAAANREQADDFAVQWAGQGAPLARAMPAAALVALLAAELAAARAGA